MKTHNQLIRNINGQLEGVSRMIDAKEDPYKTIIQMKAAKSALNSVMNKYIQENLWTVLEDCDDKQETCKKFIAEILNNDN